MTDRVSGRVLVFTYRRLNRFFHRLAERVFAGPITYCSSWPGLEEVDLQDDFYEFYERRDDVDGLDESDYEQIIGRSCVLRLLPSAQSRRMVNAMYRVIDALTDRVKPEYLLSVAVDNYMTDLLVRICRAKGARIVTLTAGSAPNTITVTAYGEFHSVRVPGDEEVTRTLAAFLRDDARVTYGQPFEGYPFHRHARVFAMWWAKCAAFRAAGWLRRDPLNFRYLMGSLPARDGQSSLWSYRGARYYDADWSERIARSSAPALFIPLAYTPEATVSYWLRDLRYIDYENFIVDACATLARSYLVVIKEHWAALGMRRWPFYERLRSLDGVVLVPAGETSRNVMRRVDRVLVGAGTTGVEAAVRGKKVVTLDRPYYHVDGHYVSLGSADRVADLPAMLEGFDFAPASPDNQRRIVGRMLAATLVGDILPGPQIDSEPNVSAAAESLRGYLDREPAVVDRRC